MSPPVVVLDACTLYPAALRDILMRLALHRLILARWTDAIHDEWIEAVLRDRSDLMQSFAAWVAEVGAGRPTFVSDNNGFDWQFINWYFHHFTGANPFGFSSTNLGSLYKGLVGDMTKNFKHLRKTRHTHHPVDDAMGNAEAMLVMRDEMGLKIRLS